MIFQHACLSSYKLEYQMPVYTRLLNQPKALGFVFVANGSIWTSVDTESYH